MHRLRPKIALLSLTLLLVGCFDDSDSPTSSSTTSGPQSYGTFAAWAQSEGVTLSLPGDTNLASNDVAARWDSVVNLRKYASQARADLCRIAADWASRSPRAQGWNVVTSTTDTAGTLYLVRFSVEGVSQGGLVWVPSTQGPLPLILFGHPADEGIDDSYASTLLGFLGTARSRTIVVVPAYRGEPAWLGDSLVASERSAQSPWDRDVDDGLAMLRAAAKAFPQADTTRIAAVGYSRGAGTSLLSALREPKIGSVFEIAGPADFFAPSIQRIAMGLRKGQSYSLPGLDIINTRLLEPFWRNAISADSLRRELLERSAGRLALSGLMPTTKIVFGTADTTVYPDQSWALLAADSRIAYDSISGMTHSSFLERPFQALAISSKLDGFLSAHLLK